MDGQVNVAALDARRKRLADARAILLDNRERLLESKRNATPIHPAWLSHCLSEVKDKDSVVVNESGIMQDYVETTEPGTFFSATAASGLGAGTGATLGAKLARPDKFVIGTYGDGSYMFGNPIATHFVSAESNLPVLHVVFNNSVWQAVRNSTNRVMPGGHAQKSNRPPLTYIDTANKFEKAVEVADGYGERVSELERARKVVDVEKRQALLNVICS